MLLTADLHLDDKPENAYRWRVFDALAANSDGEIYILGDLADRADRHSAVLVNQLIDRLTALVEAGNRLHILCGNHDRPQTGEPYWAFLNKLPGISFYTQPTAVADRLFLPYTPNPRVAWEGIPFELYNAVFLHQTVNGADAGHGQTLSNPNMVDFAVKAHIYAGDIHVPQVCGAVTYVGSPHPIKFGDSYKCRFLLLDGETYGIRREVILRRIRKRILEIRDTRQLASLQLGPGDQARVRFTLPAANITQWPVEQQAIATWAREKGVHLASVEVVLEGESRQQVEQFGFDADPEQVLRAYCTQEGIGGELLESGLAFLKSLHGASSCR